MRPFEVALLVVVAAGLLGWIAGAGWARTRGWAAIVGLALGAQLLVEGARLPLVTAYLLAVLLLARISWRQPAEPVARGGLGVAVRGVGALAGLALAAAPPFLLPVFTLPAPRGPNAVGGAAFAVIDSTRDESFAGDDARHPRAFPVRVWYPAPAGTTGRLAPYASVPELASPIVKILPPALVHQYRYVRTHTVVDAPLLPQPGPFPVLLFSHGYTGYSAQNTPQMEELASRGYVVFAIAHSYDAASAVFPDGRVVRLDPVVVKLMSGAASNGDSVRAATESKIEALRRAGTPADRQARFHDYMTSNPERLNRSFPVWAADTRALLDYLERQPRTGPAGRFAGKLDLTGVGVFGMSFGGSNAGEVCRIDRRCKAGVNIDGQQFGPLIDDSLTVPFMIIASETAVPVHRAIVDRLRGPGYFLVLKGTQHVGLTDLPYLAPYLFSRMGVTGTMPVERTEQVLNDYLVGFFDRYLRDRPSALLDQPSSAPDLEFTAVNR